MIQRIAEKDRADRYPRELRQGLASVNLRAVYDIREAVAALVAAVGGPEIMKQRFRSRQALDDALVDIDFDEIIAHTRFRHDFNVPFGEIPHIDMDDREYQEATVVEVVRGAVAMRIREDFLRTVFPYAREKKPQPPHAVAGAVQRVAPASKGNGV